MAALTRITAPASVLTPGHQERLRALWEQHASSVRRFLRTRGASAALADDLTSLVFEAAARQHARGRADDVTVQWLFTVARRRLVDERRAAARRQVRHQKLINERSTPFPSEVSIEDRDEILSTLSRLSPSHRAALSARYLGGGSVSQVAAELGLSYEAAASSLARARRSFRDHYSG